ncbi:protein phosphatase 2C domain-containing protein [Candidatus Nomurabacteria bacterium]|nr:protein phosphatase 2C domain-containing protein [Candidatus Nomurabacteria bacterium]
MQNRPPLENTNFPPQNMQEEQKVSIDWSTESVACEAHPDVNEDAILADEEHRAFGVFDGMGGHDDAEAAAKASAEYMKGRLLEIEGGLSLEEAREKFAQIIKETDIFLQEKFQNYKDKKPATTCSVLKIHKDERGREWALIGSVGDSRVYKISPGGALEQMTKDDDSINDIRNWPGIDEQTRIAAQEKMARKIANARSLGELEDKEKSFFMTRNVITIALGLNIEAPAISALHLEKGERFLITSDGIHDNLTTGEIEETVNELGTPAEISKKLVEKSLARSRQGKDEEPRAKPDDMTAIVVEIEPSKEKAKGALGTIEKVKKAARAMGDSLKIFPEAIGELAEAEAGEYKPAGRKKIANKSSAPKINLLNNKLEGQTKIPPRITKQAPERKPEDAQELRAIAWDIEKSISEGQRLVHDEGLYVSAEEELNTALHLLQRLKEAHYEDEYAVAEQAEKIADFEYKITQLKNKVGPINKDAAAAIEKEREIERAQKIAEIKAIIEASRAQQTTDQDELLKKRAEKVAEIRAKIKGN